MSRPDKPQVTRCKRCGATCEGSRVAVSFYYQSVGWRRWSKLCRTCSRMLIQLHPMYRRRVE
jgi:hypothetical protein